MLDVVGLRFHYTANRPSVAVSFPLKDKKEEELAPQLVHTTYAYVLDGGSNRSEHHNDNGSPYTRNVSHFLAKHLEVRQSQVSLKDMYQNIKKSDTFFSLTIRTFILLGIALKW